MTPFQLIYLRTPSRKRITVLNNSNDDVLFKTGQSIKMLHNASSALYAIQVANTLVPVEKEYFATTFIQYTNKSIEWHNFFIRICLGKGIDNTHLLITYVMRTLSAPAV